MVKQSGRRALALDRRHQGGKGQNLRLLHDGQVHRLIDLDLLGVDHRTTVTAGDASAALNSGYALAG